MSSRARRLAGPVVLGEGVVLALVCVGYSISLLIGHPHNRGLALFGALLGLVFGLGLMLAGRSLRRGSGRAAWTPSLLAQILALPVGFGLLQGDQAVIAALVLVPALAALVLLVLGAPRPEG